MSTHVKVDTETLLRKQLNNIVKLAEASGFVVRITGKPRHPLATGNQEHIVEVRQARKMAARKDDA